MEEKRFPYRVLVENAEIKRLLRMPRYKWEDNIKMWGLKVGREGCVVVLVELRCDYRDFMNTVMNFRIP
jgi:hypothetical protein